MSRLSRFGFVHDKTRANAIIGVTDCSENTFFIILDDPLYGSKVMIDVEMNGHTYSVVGEPSKTRTKFYWRLGKSKNDTQFDFVDKQPVGSASEPWPTVSVAPLEASVTVSTFVGDHESYPKKTEPMYGAGWALARSLPLSLSTTSEVNNEIEKEDIGMPFSKTYTVMPTKPNILESEVGLVLKTHEAKQSSAKLTFEGRKILSAGELYTDETTQETGVVFEDYDLTDYEKYPISVVMQGRLKYDQVSAEAQAKIEDFAKQGLYLIGKGVD